MTDTLSPPDSALLDVRCVATLLDCSTRHVRRLADGGRMPAPLKLGHLLRWRRATGDPATGVADWIADGCKPVLAQGAGR